MGRRLPGSTVFPARGLVVIARVREADRSVLDSDTTILATYYGNVVVKGSKKSLFFLRGLPSDVKSALTWNNNLLTW
jgi:hypothetical protein